MRAFLMASLLAAAILAGCFSDDGVETPPQTPTAPAERLVPPGDPMPEGAGHLHSDPSAHEFFWNYELSSHDPMMGNAANVAGVHALDLQADHLFGAVYGSHGASVDGGLWIWDVSDPANPVKTGSLTIPGSVGGDRSVGATFDGAFAVLGLEPVTCFGHVNPVAAGVQLLLVDTSDKSLPVVADSVLFSGQSAGDVARISPSVGGGIHSVEVHTYNETDYAFAFGDVYRIDRTENGGRLVYVSHFSIGHDLYVRDNPDGTVWGLAANGDGDFAIFDLTDPTAPAELGRWDIEDREDLPDSRYLHTADVAWIDGRALVVLTSEDWEAHPSPFWVLDATDPTAIVQVGYWENPWKRTALEIHFSLHNPRFHDGGILSLAQYHGGLLQFDFRDNRTWADPYLVAYAVSASGSSASMRDPAEHVIETQLCGLGETNPGQGNDTPLYMDVEYSPDGSGVLYAADLTGGLYTFKPTAGHPVYGTSGEQKHVH